MAGWTRARSNHSGRKTRRARTCVVRGSARSRLAAAHAGREPGNPRPAGPCGGLLASAVAPAGPDVLVGRSFRNANQMTVTGRAISLVTKALDGCQGLLVT